MRRAAIGAAIVGAVFLVNQPAPTAAQQAAACDDLAIARAMCEIAGHDMAMKVLQSEAKALEDSGQQIAPERGRHMKVLFDAHRITGKNATGRIWQCMDKGAIGESRLRRISGAVDGVTKPHLDRLLAGSPGETRLDQAISFAETNMETSCQGLLF